VLLRPIEERGGGVMGGRPLRLRGMGGRKRGGAHGAVAREEGEAALGQCEEEEGQVPRGLRGLVGRLAAWAGRPNVKEKNFWIKNWIFLNLTRLWKIVEGDLGGILT
jgi:hypothetical protein